MKTLKGAYSKNVGDVRFAPDTTRFVQPQQMLRWPDHLTFSLTQMIAPPLNSSFLPTLQQFLEF
ncbi:hypothetical protein A6X20_12570 [Bradyrhizobium elkanii]|nr:hypothetical protein A6X20_12570 [Bradyrhizobium elkanii]